MTPYPSAQRPSAAPLVLAVAVLVSGAALLIYALVPGGRSHKKDKEKVAEVESRAEERTEEAAKQVEELPEKATEAAPPTDAGPPPGPLAPQPPAAVPKVVGYTQNEAVREVRKAGLEPSIVGTPSREQPEGTVVNQSPPGGSPVPKDKQVKLYVARRAAPPPPNPPPTPTVRRGNYILPQSEYRALRDDDLDPLSRRDLRLARNEIYARHGRMFADADVQAYFDRQGWYRRNPNYHDGLLSRTESYNISYLQDYERRRDRGGVFTPPRRPPTSSSQILPQSASRQLTNDDIAGLNPRERYYARNEIYARHGYIFRSRELRQYFESKTWYTPRRGVSEADLTPVERYNVQFLAAHGG